MSEKVFPLGFLEVSHNAVISELIGGKRLVQRLVEMGLVKGAKISVLKNDGDGPLIVSLGAGRLAIGRGMALKIMVEARSSD